MNIRFAILAFLLMTLTLALTNCALEDPESPIEEEVIDTEELEPDPEDGEILFSSLTTGEDGASTDSRSSAVGTEAVCRSCADMKAQARNYCARVGRTMCNAVCTPRCSFGGFIDMRFSCCR